MLNPIFSETHQSCDLSSSSTDVLVDKPESSSRHESEDFQVETDDDENNNNDDDDAAPLPKESKLVDTPHKKDSKLILQTWFQLQHKTRDSKNNNSSKRKKKNACWKFVQPMQRKAECVS